MSESDVRKFEDEITALKAENNLLRQQLAAKEEKIEAEVEKRKVAEVNLKHHTKLSSIIFARWVLQMFTDHILSELDPELKPDRITSRTTSRIQAAWSMFFEGKSENSIVSKAFGKCDVLLFGFTKITQCVEELRSRKLTRHRCKSMGEEVRHWVAGRSSELYFKFSVCIHNLMQIKWFVDYEELAIFLEALPNVTDADRELITLVHILVRDIIPAEILKEAAERVQLFERISS